MRWAMLAIVFFSLVCSGFSADANEEPSLKIMARSSVYNIGEKKGIYCEGSNVEEQIEWLSPSNEVVQGRSTKNTRVYVERRSAEPNLVALIIHSTKIKDSGVWTCKAGELTQTIEIVVGEKVEFSAESENVESDEGKSVKLNCEAKGNPQPVVQWYNKEGTVITDDSKYVLRVKDDVHTLEIKRLTHADAGEYLCKATQKALSYYTHKTIKLNVHHKPIPFNPDTKEIYTIAAGAKYRTEEVFAVYNETKNITCSALAYPPPKFQWYRRKHNFDQPIREEETIHTSEDFMSSTLTLRMRDDTDKGQYKCTASNDKGQISTIFDVTPGEKPIPPDNITLSSFNHTHMMFNVICSSNCSFLEDENAPLDPENLPITGYSFQIVPYRENYPVDWENTSSSWEFSVDIIDPDDTLFAVGPLPNSTQFHVRVRSINAAGFSDWLNYPENLDLPQTSEAINTVATFFLLVIAFVFTKCY